jgi:methanogenic corrinoid protein MtbC1
MGSSPTFTAEILRASTSGLARLATQRLIPRLKPDGPGLGRDADRAWGEHLSGRLADLAQAVDEGRASTFLDQVAWSKVAFRSRDVPLEDLRASLECLHEVLTSELPPDSGEQPARFVRGALDALDDMVAELPAGLEPGAPHGALAARFMVALLEGDRAIASRHVLDAVKAGDLSVHDALVEVCVVAQRELGRMWHMNEITVAEEHFCTASTVRLVSQLMELAPPVEPNGRTVLAASIGEDEHDVGLRIVTELFELDGWRVVFLGARLPAADLTWSVSTFAPDLVLLSAAMEGHRAGVATAVSSLRAAGLDTPVVVGGPGFRGGEETLWRAAGADAWARSADEALQAGRRLAGLSAG